MEDLFREIFGKYGLSEDQLNKMMGEFGSVFLLALVANAKDLEQSDIVKIHQYWDENRHGEIFSILKSKYTEGEWKKYAREQAVSLLQSYVEDLLHA